MVNFFFRIIFLLENRKKCKHKKGKKIPAGGGEEEVVFNFEARQGGSPILSTRARLYTARQGFYINSCPRYEG